MPAQKRPEQKSAYSETPTPDQSRPQPTGAESYTTPTDKAERPERETGGGGAQAGEPDWDRYLTDSVTRLQEVAIDYFNKLGDTASDLTGQARKVYDSGRNYVGSHPSSTLGGAFLFGLLVGFLVDRD